MAGPIHPRLLKRARATRRFLVATVLHPARRLLIEGGVRGAALRAGLGSSSSPVFAHRSAASVKSKLRRDILTARLATPVGAASSASLIRTVTQGLDALDGYFSKYLPQLGLAATVPFLVGGAILLADWPSAIIVAFTLPLIPVFMALIGWTTEKATARSFGVADRLANHFADLIAGLPTLQAFARAGRRSEGWSSARSSTATPP